MSAVASYLWWRGSSERLLGQRGYILVATGMTLVLMGLVLDLADDFPTTQRLVYVGDDPFADKLRWFVGYLFGGVLILVGFTQWVPINVALRRSQEDLRKSNEELRSEALERQRAQSALASLRLRMLDLQEDERRDIARELHDDFGQDLTALKFIVSQLSELPGAEDGSSADRQVEIIDRLFTKVRDLSLQLQPPVLDDMGLVPATSWLIKSYEKDTRLQVSFEDDGLQGRLDVRIENAAYRVVQEGLTNVVRHAQTSQAALIYSVTDGTLQVVLEDQGVGFSGGTDTHRMASVGLPAMRERVEALGGTMTIDSSVGTGTTLKVDLPLDL